MQPGDRLLWHYQHRGGYGGLLLYPVEVIKVGPKRVQVRVELRRGGFALRWVSPEHLHPDR